MRTWIKLIPVVLLAVPFTWSSIHAEETTDQKIKNLQDDVAKIRKDLESLKDEVRTSSVQGAKVAADLQDIKRLLHDMSDRQAVISRQSAYDPRSLLPGAPPPGGPPLPAAGTITVQNNYAARATVRINGRPYVVDPGQPMPIVGVPTGTFQYSVDVEGFGMVEPLRTDILPATGYRITIFPRIP
jgi:hypothetical protein